MGHPPLTLLERVWVRTGRTIRAVRSIHARTGLTLKEALSVVRAAPDYGSPDARAGRTRAWNNIAAFVEDDDDDGTAATD